MEVWKDIQNFEGSYQISSLGNVRSMDRTSAQGQKLKSRPMKLDLIKGYYRIGLTKYAIQYRSLVHRLVARHFIGNPLNKPSVNHKDGVKTNNAVQNLEWATYKEQHLHAVENNLRARGTNQKLSISQIKEIKKLLAQKITLKKIAQEYKVSWGLIGLIKQGRLHSNI